MHKISPWYAMRKADDYLFLVCSPGVVFTKIGLYKWSDEKGRYDLHGYPFHWTYWANVISKDKDRWRDRMSKWNQEQWDLFHMEDVLRDEEPLVSYGN